MSGVGCDDDLVMPLACHIISCVPRPHWIFRLYMTRQPVEVIPPHPARPGQRSFDSPNHVSTFHPQVVTAPFCCGGKFFDCLPMGLPSDPYILQEACGGQGYKSSAAHLHWPQLHRTWTRSGRKLVTPSLGGKVSLWLRSIHISQFQAEWLSPLFHPFSDKVCFLWGKRHLEAWH